MEPCAISSAISNEFSLTDTLSFEIRIAAVTAVPHALPLRQPWPGAGLGSGVRRGCLLRVDTTDGRHGYGECAPLPSHGSESHAAAATALQVWCTALPGRDVHEALTALAADTTARATPAARAAVECALLDLAAQAAGVPLRRLLAPAAGDAVAVNAMAGDVLGATPARIDALLAEGYRVIKLKLGAADAASEIAALRALAGTLPPTVRLRLDANRAWDAATAGAVCAALAGLPVEALEEPLDSPTPAALATLQRGLPFALAIDESWQELAGADAEDFFAAPPVRRLVLKPAVLGGLQPTLALAQRARAAGMECVLTTGIDGACATLAAAQLVAALGNGAVPGPAHGLATSHWLAKDIGTPPPVVAGRIALPPAPGLGFTPAACAPSR